MWIKINESGCILGHDYQQTQECVTEIGDNILVNMVGEYSGCYKYKYIEGSLIELTQEEMAQHPLYLAKLREQAIQQQLKNIEFGKRLIALVGVMLNIKNLTVEQTAQFNATFANIITLLQTGSLLTAKEAIAVIVPNAIVLQSDKDTVLEELNAYLGL